MDTLEVDESAQVFGPRYFREMGKDARAIIDVGVYKGTKYLYESFKELPFILIDPQKDCEAMLEDKPKTSIFLPVAVGSAPGRMVINQQGAKSSFAERTELTRRNGPKERYEVEITTLDDVLDKSPYPGPYGLKIDTEGHEVEVMKGLVRHAADIAFIICEASIRKRFINPYRFSDLIAVMRDRGFEFYTVLNEVKRRPRFYDVLFLRPNHPYFD